MRDYDNEILKTNIRKLRDDSGLSQEKFAEIAGVHQSRLSKLLGSDDGSRFSIEQIYRIAKHFCVSIDYLVTGEKNKPVSSAKSLCEILIQLFDEFHLEHTDYSREEFVDVLCFHYDEMDRRVEYYDSEKKNIKHHALFFPHGSSPDPNREYTESELEDLQDDARKNGSDLPKNIAINRFLDAYIPIHELHSAGKMPDEAYKYTINSLLDGIEN